MADGRQHRQQAERVACGRGAQLVTCGFVRRAAARGTGRVGTHQRGPCPRWEVTARGVGPHPRGPCPRWGVEVRPGVGPTLPPPGATVSLTSRVGATVHGSSIGSRFGLPVTAPYVLAPRSLPLCLCVCTRPGQSPSPHLAVADAHAAPTAVAATAVGPAAAGSGDTADAAAAVELAGTAPPATAPPGSAAVATGAAAAPN